MMRFAPLACALLLVFTSGCGDEKMQKIGQKAAETWTAVAEYTVEKKDQALIFFGERMKGLQGQWEATKEQSAEWSAEAKTALESKWQRVQDAYAKSKNAGGETWGKARDAFKAAYDAFKAELDK